MFRAHPAADPFATPYLNRGKEAPEDAMMMKTMSSSRSVTTVATAASSCDGESVASRSNLMGRVPSFSRFSANNKSGSSRRGASRSKLIPFADMSRNDSFRSLCTPAEDEERQASLLKIRQAIQVQSKHEEEVKANIRVHKDRAMARYASNNNVGAVLSMRRLKHLEMDEVNIEKTIGYLRKLEQDFLNENDMAEPNGGSNSDISLDSANDSLSAMFSHSCRKAADDRSRMDVDFELDRIVNTQVDYSSISNSDDDLLAELEASM